MPAYYENTFKNISEIPETKKNHVFERFDYYLLLQDNTSNITENFFQGGGQGPGIFGSQSLTSPPPPQNDSAGVPKWLYYVNILLKVIQMIINYIILV